MQPRPFPRVLVALVVAIAVVNAFAEHYYWYWLMRWFDMPMHFAGGVFVAGTALWWRFFSGKFPDASRGFTALLAWGVGAALGVGIVWEVYEAGVSFATVGHFNDMIDTLSDLFFDFLGGFAATMWVYVRMKK